MNKIRLHIFGLPHTITRDEYSHCAFTGKIQRFSPMMKSVGYEVYYYGNESSITEADVQVDILSLNEFNQLKYASYKMLFPNLNDNEIINKMNNRKEFIRERAIKLFDMYSIAHTYDYAFKSILNIHNGTNGWYSTNTTIHLLKE